MRAVCIGLLLFLLPAFADAATYYVRPASAEYSAENGADCANAFDGFSDIAGLAAGDTININGTHAEALTIPTSGTLASRITFQSDTSCGDGAGIINATGLANGVTSNGKSYVTVTGIECYGSTAACMTITGAAGTRVIYTLNNVHDTIGAASYGMTQDPALDAARFTDNEFTYNTVTRAGYCGILVIGAVDRAIVQDNLVTYSGVSQECHGISAIPRRNFFTSGWTDAGGNVYHQTVGAQTHLTSVTAIPYVFWLKISPFTRQVLTQNTATPTTPALNEYGFSGGSLYVNVGENPAGDASEFVYFAYLMPTALQILHNDVSYGQFTSLEGTGIQLDDGMSDAVVKRNYIHDNEGYGMIVNYGSRNIIAGNLLVRNALGGVYVTNGATSTKLVNNTFHTNGDGVTNLNANIIGSLTSRLTDLINNSIVGGWGIYANNTQSQVFHDVLGNNIFGFTTKEQNIGCTGGGTCGTRTVLDPLLLSNYRTGANSPMRRAGTPNVHCIDYRNRPCWNPPDIGAFQASSGDQPNTRAVRIVP